MLSAYNAYQDPKLWASVYGETAASCLCRRLCADTASPRAYTPSFSPHRGVQGDSGFMLVRGGEVLMQSEPLQHFFDCPFQFGALPEHVSATDYAEVHLISPGRVEAILV